MPSKIRHVRTGREVGFAPDGTPTISIQAGEELVAGLEFKNPTPGAVGEEDHYSPSARFSASAYDPTEEAEASVEYEWDMFARACDVEGGGTVSVLEIVRAVNVDGVAGTPYGRVQFHQNGDILYRINDGAAAQEIGVGGNIYSHWDDAGNVAATETEIYEDVIKGNLLTGGKGRGLSCQYAGVFAAEAKDKRIRAQFHGVTVFDTGVLDIDAAADWNLQLTIIADDDPANDKARVVAVWTSTSAGLLSKVTVTAVSAIDLTANHTVKLLFDAEAGSNDDIILAKLGLVQYIGPDMTSMAFID